MGRQEAGNLRGGSGGLKAAQSPAKTRRTSTPTPPRQEEEGCRGARLRGEPGRRVSARSPRRDTPKASSASIRIDTPRTRRARVAVLVHKTDSARSKIVQTAIDRSVLRFPKPRANNDVAFPRLARPRGPRGGCGSGVGSHDGTSASGRDGWLERPGRGRRVLRRVAPAPRRRFTETRVGQNRA